MSQVPRTRFIPAAVRFAAKETQRKQGMSWTTFFAVVGLGLSILNAFRLEVVSGAEKRTLLVTDTMDTLESAKAFETERRDYDAYMTRHLEGASVAWPGRIEALKAQEKSSEDIAGQLRDMVKQLEDQAENLATGKGWYSAAVLERQRASLVRGRRMLENMRRDDRSLRQMFESFDAEIAEALRANPQFQQQQERPHR